LEERKSSHRQQTSAFFPFLFPFISSSFFSFGSSSTWVVVVESKVKSAFVTLLYCCLFSVLLAGNGKPDKLVTGGNTNQPME